MAGFQKGMHAAERDRAIAESLTRIREIKSRKGISQGTLEDIKGVLTELSVKKELFSEEELPSPESGARLYCLSEDDDHRFALYLSTGAPGKATPPHPIITPPGRSLSVWRVKKRTEFTSAPTVDYAKSIPSSSRRAWGAITCLTSTLR